MLALGNAAPVLLLARFADIELTPEFSFDLTEQMTKRGRAKAVRIELTDEQTRALGGLPKKVAESVRSMIRRGADIQARKVAGEGGNPFSKQKNKALFVVFSVIQNYGLPASWVLLRDALVRGLHWSESAAASETTKTIKILMALDLVVEQEGVFVLSPSLKGEHKGLKHKGKQ